jgi:hypothetical protein
MKLCPSPNFFSLALFSILGLLATGCVHHETTVYRDVDRVKVEFENDAAARTFYEAMTKNPYPKFKEENKTQVMIPLIFEHSHRVVSGQNLVFNSAVIACDTNQDGRITESEARIYAAQKIPVRADASQP